MNEINVPNCKKFLIIIYSEGCRVKIGLNTSLFSIKTQIHAHIKRVKKRNMVLYPIINIYIYMHSR